MDRARRTDKRWELVPTPVTSGPNHDGRARIVLWAAYALMGVLLAGYLASLIVRGSDQWPLFSDWSVAGFEVVASALCLARGFTRRPGPALRCFGG